MTQTTPLIDGAHATGRAESDSGRRVWLLLVDPLPNRIFFDCGIVDALRQALPDRLTLIFLVHKKHIRPWLDRAEGLPVLDGDDLLPVQVPFGERIVRRLDIELDRRVGFLPLAVRHSLRHGFHQGRWISGHRNWFLDPDHAGLLPRWIFLERLMARWHFSARRYAPSRLLERMRAECDLLVVTSAQTHGSMPFLTAARRLRVPVVGYVASWDHAVGKGVVSPHLDRYVVQNETMREDLRRYHGIGPERVVVTGWPQTDVYHRRHSRAEYEALLQRLGLDPARPAVLYAGNTPTNQPYEGNLVRRLVGWWADSGAQERFQLLFRPHPRDNQVAERFGAALGRPGAAVQPASYTDFADLATLLQHVACVVANGGTIVLDGVVNDRPSVCITFDEGAPAGERWADLNLGGEHYRELINSDAIYRADDFDGLVAAIERALEHPGEHAAERRRVSLDAVGEVDGRAVERIVDAIVDCLGVRAAR
jgi:CDP-Glycerol:Poly(glycerophosphate) glycerophosphotransferase